MSNKNHYIFPAIFHYAEDGISVEFPDLPGAYTCGNNDEETLTMAKECLGLHLYGMEKDGDEIPDPSPLQSLKVQTNEVVVLISVWMPAFRDTMENKAVKLTLTIPAWVKQAADEHKLNYSRLLRTAIIDHLDLKR